MSDALPPVPPLAANKRRPSSTIGPDGLPEGISRIPTSGQFGRRTSQIDETLTELPPPVEPQASTTTAPESPSSKKKVTSSGKKRLVKKKSLDGGDEQLDIDPVTGEKVKSKKKKASSGAKKKRSQSESAAEELVNGHKSHLLPHQYAQPPPPPEEKSWPVQNDINWDEIDEMYKKQQANKKRIRFRKYCLDDFNVLNVLGRGSFGKVCRRC